MKYEGGVPLVDGVHGPLDGLLVRALVGDGKREDLEILDPPGFAWGLLMPHEI